MEKYFEIGKITGTHGLKGTFKVFPTTENPKRFELLENIIINNKGEFKTFEISKIAYHKKFVLVTVKEIDDINIAENYKGATILISENLAIPLEEDEYYARDLYDMEVLTEDGESIGIISDIFETGANDVYCIKRDNKKDLLIPAIKQCIISVDIKNKKMIVRILKGLDD